MKKRDLIAALAPLDDDTEILIPDGLGYLREGIEYIDDRDSFTPRDQVRLYGLRDHNGRIIPPSVLGVDLLPTEKELPRRMCRA